MRIASIKAQNHPPVGLFHADGLSDVVVIGGPNGVGKTRLVQQLLNFLQSAGPNPNFEVSIEATCKEERDNWGQQSLRTAVEAEANKFKKMLQRNRRRRNWKSGVLNFESDRTIQQIKPFPFSWDICDPYDEEVGWNTTFGYMRDRFQDTLHSMFRVIQHQKQNIANRAIQLRRQGKEEMSLGFDDPMDPFKEAFSQLLAPKELVDPSPQQQKLEYRLDGNVLAFSTLSSGEREVVNIVFDFLLRHPSDCVIVFDEPELHLHPELSYKLIRTLQNIGRNNQFIFCTHSPHIISAALEHSVVFLSPPAKNTDGTPANQAKPVSEDDETNQALRLLGHSIGIISLGKKIVLIEGEQSSLDKQVYGSIIKNKYPDLVLVPSGGKDIITSLKTVQDKVLARTIWGVEFFMLCDRDALPFGDEASLSDSGTKDKFQVLNRYHLENYFLDEHVWARVFEEMEPEESWLCSAATIRDKLREIARGLISYSAALAVSASIRRKVGNVDIMPKGCHNKTADDVHGLLVNEVSSETVRIKTEFDTQELKARIDKHFSDIESSLSSDTDVWKHRLPGRPILNHFARAAELKLARAKTLYIKAAASTEEDPFAEIDDIFKAFGEHYNK